MWKHKRRHLTDLDWKRAALKAICEGGIAAVAVEPLARALGVSKGSFYWHFSSRDALLESALHYWEQQEADLFIASLSNIEEPRERIKQLILRVSQGAWNCTLHSALSAAADHPIVQPVLKRISEKRIGYLAECYGSLGFSDEDAHHRALVCYTIYVGFIHLSRESQQAQPIQERYIRHIIETLLPGPIAHRLPDFLVSRTDAAAG
jgi:AcrR family transcriptional regulator